MLGSGKRKLLRMFPKDSIGAEIGVWMGAFSHMILEIVKPRLLYLIDPWDPRPDLKGTWDCGRHKHTQADMDAVYNGVVVKFASETQQGRVKIIRGASPTALDTIPDAGLDWVYIDGDHMYDAVRHDLLAATRKVKPSGFIAGDDYEFKGWWHDGVTRAVDEYVAASGAEFTRVGNHQFILRPVSVLRV